MLLPFDEPVGDGDVGGEVLGGGVLLEDAADADVEAPESLDLLAPELITVHVGKGDDVPALQDAQAFVELTLAAGGEPDVLRHQAPGYIRPALRSA